MSSATSTPGTPSLTRYRFNDPGTPVEKVNIAFWSLKIYHNRRRGAHVYSAQESKVSCLEKFSLCFWSQVLHLRVAFYLCFKNSYENEFIFLKIKLTFIWRVCIRTRFETETQGHSEKAFLLDLEHFFWLTHASEVSRCGVIIYVTVA